MDIKWLLQKLENKIDFILLKDEDKELVQIISNTDEMTLSEKEKKQWIKKLPLMSKEDKEKLRNILLEGNEKTKKIDKIKEGMKLFYKNELDKIKIFNKKLENIIKIFEDNLNSLKIFSKNPIKGKSIEELQVLNYLSENEVEGIKNKINKAKQEPTNSNKEKILIEYLYQIQQGRDIQDIEIEMKNKEKEIKNNIIDKVSLLWWLLKDFDYMENKHNLLDNQEVDKFNNNLAILYVYLKYC